MDKTIWICLLGFLFFVFLCKWADEEVSRSIECSKKCQCKLSKAHLQHYPVRYEFLFWYPRRDYFPSTNSVLSLWGLFLIPGPGFWSFYPCCYTQSLDPGITVNTGWVIFKCQPYDIRFRSHLCIKVSSSSVFIQWCCNIATKKYLRSKK